MSAKRTWFFPRTYRRVGLGVAFVAVIEMRGVPLPFTLGVANGSGVAVGVEGSRVGMGPWVGVLGTGRLGNVMRAGGEVGTGILVAISSVEMGAGCD